MRFTVYIPARYASTRLPGKPLLEVAGRSLIHHVYDNAVASGATAVIVATDDQRIATHVESFGGAVQMTASTHTSGTDRIAEAVAARGEPNDDIIVNVQGDEPLLPPAVIRQVAEVLVVEPAVDIATVCEPVRDAADLTDSNIVKVVRGKGDRALYFSRAPIPHARDEAHAPLAMCRRHVGIYAYRVRYLRRFVALPPAALEQIERLEQLRASASGAVIACPDAAADCGAGIDTPADLERLRASWRTSA